MTAWTHVLAASHEEGYLGGYAFAERLDADVLREGVMLCVPAHDDTEAAAAVVGRVTDEAAPAWAAWFASLWLAGYTQGHADQEAGAAATLDPDNLTLPPEADRTPATLLQAFAYPIPAEALDDLAAVLDAVPPGDVPTWFRWFAAMAAMGYHTGYADGLDGRDVRADVGGAA